MDAHLDLAWNVLQGRDYALDAAAVRAAEPGDGQRCMVTLPELRRGGVAVAFGTLFVGTEIFDDRGVPIHAEPTDEAAKRQLEVYLDWENTGRARIIRDRAALEAHLARWRGDGVLGIVVLIEGGDSILSPSDLPSWFDAGVRVIGPAWSGTRYAGGTNRPGGLTEAGRELVAGMRELGIVLDASHLAEEAFWDVFDVGPGPIVASHSNARALVDTDRQLSDDMVRAIGAAGGVIGINLYNRFLDAAWEPPRTVTLETVGAHAAHIATLVGWDHVGIGSDLDGGLGVDETPVELGSAADLVRVGEAVPDETRVAVLGGNWLRFLEGALPDKHVPRTRGEAGA